MEKRKIDIVKRNKIHRSFDSNNPRERNACPECGSISIKKRNRTYDYECYRCGWIGESPRKIIW